MEITVNDIHNTTYIGWDVYFNKEKNFAFRESVDGVEVGFVGNKNSWALSQEEKDSVINAVKDYKEMRDKSRRKFYGEGGEEVRAVNLIVLEDPNDELG